MRKELIAYGVIAILLIGITLTACDGADSDHSCSSHEDCWSSGYCANGENCFECNYETCMWLCCAYMDCEDHVGRISISEVCFADCATDPTIHCPRAEPYIWTPCTNSSRCKADFECDHNRCKGTPSCHADWDCSLGSNCVANKCTIYR